MDHALPTLAAMFEVNVVLVDRAGQETVASQQLAGFHNPLYPTVYVVHSGLSHYAPFVDPSEMKRLQICSLCAGVADGVQPGGYDAVDATVVCCMSAKCCRHGRECGHVLGPPVLARQGPPHLDVIA